MEIAELENLIDKNTVIDSLAPSTVCGYRTGWRGLKNWLADKQICHFGETEVRSYLEEKLGKAVYADAELTCSQKKLTSSCETLINFINTGVMERKAFARTVDFAASEVGDAGRYYREFILSLSCRLKPGTIVSYKISLSILYRYCKNHQLTLPELTAFHLARLFDGSGLQHNSIYTHKGKIKAFLRWLFTKGHTAQDLSLLVPKEKLVKDAKLPTTFTNEEVKAILNSIDRGTASGRRDFAILLCIAAYGWRISDVCQLRLSHFNWREQSVSFVQVKTGEPLQTRLEPLVFSAIVDYIQHGRPNDPAYDELNNGELFLSLSKGKEGRALHPDTLNHILYKYLRRAGITNLSQRKHGCHALRFSLATRMIEDGADIREVKDTLGHKDKSVTFNYVRLDLAGLKRCNLPMAPCQSPFYSDLKEGN